MENTTLLFVLFGANALVLLLNIGFWVLVSFGDRKVKKREQELYDKFNTVLDQANTSAADIVRQASKKSVQILSNSQVLVEDIQKELRLSLETAKDKNLVDMQNMLKDMQLQHRQFVLDLQQSLIANAREVFAKVSGELHSDMQKYIDEVKMQTVNLQKSAEKKLTEEVDQVKVEIEEYKQKKYEKVDTEISQLVQEVLNSAVPGMIQVADHERLIRERLEELKKKGVLSDG